MSVAGRVLVAQTVGSVAGRMLVSQAVGSVEGRMSVAGNACHTDCWVWTLPPPTNQHGSIIQLQVKISSSMTLFSKVVTCFRGL